MEVPSDSSNLNENLQLAALTRTAFHEAGHAVMAVLLGRSVQKVSIVSGQMVTGATRLGHCELKRGRSKPSSDWIEDEALILLAGMIGEAHFTGVLSTHGASQDRKNVKRLLQNRASSERQLERLEQKLIGYASSILDEPAAREAIRRVAIELLARDKISGRTVLHIVNECRRAS